MTAEEVKDALLEAGLEGAVVMDDFAPAFVGYTSDDRAVYEFERMIETLMTRDGMSEEEALEWIDYNTVRALPYMGDRAPVILYQIVN